MSIARSDGEHFASVRQRFFSEIYTAEHARHFFDALWVVELGDGGAGFFAAALLVDKQVLMSLGSDLWQVGDRQHLATLAQAAQ